MESRRSDIYNVNHLENDEAKRRVIPNLPPRPQATFTHQIDNQTNPANALDTSFQRRAYYRHWRVNLRHSWHSQFLADRSWDKLGLGFLETLPDLHRRRKSLPAGCLGSSHDNVLQRIECAGVPVIRNSLVGLAPYPGKFRALNQIGEFHCHSFFSELRPLPVAVQ